MRGKIIHYNGNDGKGLIAAGERQFPFNISQWSCDSAPAVNQTVDVTLDEAGAASRIVIVDAQTLARERLSQFASLSGDQGQQAAIRGKVALQQVSGRMGVSLMIVCAVLFIAWFFVPALSINTGFVEKAFSVSDVLSLDLQRGGTSFGFWSLLGLVAVVLPWLAPWLRARWASIFLCAPLLMIIVAYLHVRWQMHVSVANAIDQAGQLGGAQAQAMVQGMVDQMAANVAKAISYDLGFWIVLLLGLYLAVMGIKRYRSTPRFVPAHP